MRHLVLLMGMLLDTRNIPRIQSLRAEMARRQAGNRSVAISRLLRQCSSRSPRPRSNRGLAMTGSVSRLLSLLSVWLVLLVIATNTTADSLVVQGQNAAGIYDAKMYQNYNDINFGGSQTLTILNSFSLHRRALFKFTNMDTVGAGMVIDSMAIDLYCTSQSSATIGMYELWKDWYEGNSDNAVETGAVDDIHWRHNDSSWTREMADSANDNGVQNRSNGTGADRRATAMATVTVSAASSWHRFRVNSELSQDWYDGTKQPFGVILMETGITGTTVFASSEYATPAYRPKVTIYYHAATNEAGSRRRLLLLTSNP